VVLFENLRDNALTFTVYFWLELVSVRDNRAIVSELRHRIAEAWPAPGMVIAFPQRDVHDRCADPDAVKIIPPGNDDKGKRYAKILETGITFSNA